MPKTSKSLFRRKIRSTGEHAIPTGSRAKPSRREERPQSEKDGRKAEPFGFIGDLML